MGEPNKEVRAVGVQWKDGTNSIFDVPKEQLDQYIISKHPDVSSISFFDINGDFHIINLNATWRVTFTSKRESS